MKGNLKSRVSFELNLTRSLLKDIFVHHQLPSTEVNRDFAAIKSRTQDEGLEFLTKTLPSLAKSLDEALKTGFFRTPTSFKRKRRSSNLPAFMHGLFKKIFSEDGTLLEKGCDICAIADIRQLCYLFYKYQLPYKESQVNEMFQDFVDTDKDIQCHWTSAEQLATVFYARRIINEIFRDFTFEFRPKNGPGSVANSIPPWRRYAPTRFYPELDSLVDYSESFYYNDRHFFDQFSTYFELDYEPHGTAKCLAVPKDSRGPRLISAETSEFMLYQQALKCALVPYLERHKLTAGRVNFTRQEINGELALKASLDQSFATLDLKKASDLLSHCLVDDLFSDTPIHDYLMKTRSSKTLLPDGRLIELNKFAPMGSALCFPIQAITYFAVIAGSRLAEQISLPNAVRDIFVYGDDIIIPNDESSSAIAALQSVGLQVNEDKSCFSGYFRESCGVDAYKGVDITPIKLKKVWPRERLQAEILTSWVAASNNLFARGYWQTSDFIRRSIEQKEGSLPLCTVDSPIIGWHTWTHDHAFMANQNRLRWDPDLHQFRIRADTLVSKTQHLLKDGWQRLLRSEWYNPVTDWNIYSEPFDSSAFSRRYQAVKRGTWVGESQF